MPTVAATENGQQDQPKGILRMKIKDAEQMQANLDYKRKAAVLGPTACVWAAKLAQPNHCPVNAAETKSQGNGVEPQRVTKPDNDFQVKGEPLYRGKGKRSGLTYNHCDIDPPDTCNHAGGNQAQAPLQTQQAVRT